MTLRDATPIPCSAFRLLCTDKDRTPLEDNRPCAKTEAHSQQREGSFSVNISCNSVQIQYLLHQFSVGSQSYINFKQMY